MRLYRSLLTSLLVVPVSFILPSPVKAQVVTPAAGNIDKFAGNYFYRNVANPIDTGVPANTVGLQNPDGLAMDSAGNLYIADKSDNLVRKVDTAGNITTIAGTGTAGSLGDGGAATSAQLSQPISVAVDAVGNLYIVDYGNHVVRKVDHTTGIITTFAGDGVAPPTSGTSSDPIGDGNLATAASLDPQSVAVNGAGDVYIADQTHRLIRKVDHTSGNISTVAGTLYTRGYLSTSENGPATSAYLDSPKALAVDASGNLYIADQYGERIFKVTPTGTINTIVGTGAAATNPTDPNGDGGLALSAQLSAPAGLAIDTAGNLFIMDQSSFRVRKVDPATNKISTVAGNGVASPAGANGTPLPEDGGLAINAKLNQYAAGLAVAPSGGFLYIADFGNSVVRVVNLAAAPTASVTLTSDLANTSLTVTGNVDACKSGPYTAPTTLTWTAQAECSVMVTVPTGYTYGGWLDAPGAANPRAFVAPGSATTYTAHLSSGTPACTNTLSALTVGFPVTATDGTVNVTSQSGCSWTATSNDPWLTVTAGTPGMANGTVSFHADVNSGSSARTGTLTVAGQTFTVTQAGTAANIPAGLRFVPVAPCRIADTREAAGPFGAPALGGQTTRDFAVMQRCGIPSDAQAYSLNFTVVPTNGNRLQYITVFPTGQTKPLASTLNSFDGRTKANAAIVPAGTNGSVSVFATESTELIVDVNGYFVPTSNTSGLAFYPMTPCRIVDTRTDTHFATGFFGPPALSAGEERNIPVQTSSCQIPATAQAYSLNYTVVPKKSKLAYLTTWPTGQGRPFVSTLNATTGAITANSAIVPAGSNGDLSVYSTDDTELLIDVNGYFAPPATGGLSFYNLTPCRILDTREAAGGQPIVNTMAVTVAGTCNAPANAQSYVFNTTVVPANSLLYLTLWAHGAAQQPTVSALNAPDGVVTSNLAIVPSSDGSVSAFAHDSTHLILDIFGYFAP